MLDLDKDKLNRLEELKRKLFSNSYKTRIEYRDNYSPVHHNDVADSWEGDKSPVDNLQEKKVNTSIFKKFFVFSIIFFVFALLFVAYQSFSGGNTVSNNNIEIAILGNTFTNGGEDLPLQIEITNKNNSALELVDLVVEYPNGTTQGENSSAVDTERIRTSIGTISAGGIKTENMSIVLFGEQGSVHEIKISIEYRVEGSNAIFVKDKEYQVTINSTPIDLLVNGPTSVNPGEDMNLSIKTSLNSKNPALNVLVKVEYPLGFQFVRATPMPSLGDNIWNLGDLSPGAENNISIVGKMTDSFDGDEKTFKVYSGSQAKNDKSVIDVVFNSLGYTVLVQKPFISARLFINGVYDREYAIDSRSPIQSEINFTNNLDTKIVDLEVKAKISGNSFNRSTISAKKGFYDSLNNTIVWNKDYDNKLAEVASYESGSVNFFFSPLSLFTSSSGFISQPTINIEVSVSGKQLLEGNSTKKLENSESKVIRIISDLGLSNKALYYSGPFKNTGPIPPKAETETTYTMVWALTNTANNISKAQIKSSLPPYMRFVGTVNPRSEDFTYNASTREILWNIGVVPRGTGISGAGREVAFQVSLTPSLSQVDEVPLLIKEVVLTGHDDFANVDVRVVKPSLSTKLTNDPIASDSTGKVVE